MPSYSYSYLEYYQLTEVEMENVTLGAKSERDGSGVECCHLMYKGCILILRSPAIVVGHPKYGQPTHCALKSGRIGETPVFPEVLRRINNAARNLTNDVFPGVGYIELVANHRDQNEEAFELYPDIADGHMTETEAGRTSGQLLCLGKHPHCGVFGICFTLVYSEKHHVTELIARVIPTQDQDQDRPCCQQHLRAFDL